MIQDYTHPPTYFVLKYWIKKAMLYYIEIKGVNC